ncbi:MAG: hypothetical protein M1816_006510 [Peltula sp. TS41687]|nr:MAG: hypothetical protein M1816_006510 [Peltula sp. TS41687]
MQNYGCLDLKRFEGYLGLTPYVVFAGAGLWHPDAGPLALLRRAVDLKPHKLKQVLTDPGLRKEFLGGVPKDEKKVIKAFIRHNEENMLKTKPKDFPGDHPDIELLRLRNYTIGKKLIDDEVLGSKGLERIAGLLGCLTPFVTYLNSVVMPDEPSSGEDASGDDDDDDNSDDNDINEAEEADES